MSTVAYGALTRKRNGAEAERSAVDQPPGLKTYADAVAALVPAEVLAAHATIVTFTTDQTERNGRKTTIISDPGTLKWVFWALLAASIVLFVVGLQHLPRGYGWSRILIPPLAFVAWTMLVSPSAFEAVFPDVSPGGKTAAAIIAALVLAPIAAALGGKADRSGRTSTGD